MLDIAHTLMMVISSSSLWAVLIATLVVRS
jgi:hypothetical protein